MSARILVVDDEKEIADFVELYLKNENFEVFKFYNGRDVLNCLEHQEIDLAILDVMLPDIDGIEVCRRIRATGSKMGIIMLSAKSQEIDKVTGLMTGADDYITKPFSPAELTARVDALIRRLGVGEDERLPLRSAAGLSCSTRATVPLKRTASASSSLRSNTCS